MVPNLGKTLPYWVSSTLSDPTKASHLLGGQRLDLDFTHIKRAFGLDSMGRSKQFYKLISTNWRN